MFCTFSYCVYARFCHTMRTLVAAVRTKDARKMYEQLVVVSLVMRPSGEYMKFVEKVVLKSKAEQVNGHIIDKSIVSQNTS